MKRCRRNVKKVDLAKTGKLKKKVVQCGNYIPDDYTISQVGTVELNELFFYVVLPNKICLVVV